MPRDTNIPLFLWIATAILAHLAWGGGANQVSLLIEERLDIQRFAAAVQQHVRLKNGAFEVTLLDAPSGPVPRPLEHDDDSDAPDDQEKPKPLEEPTVRKESASERDDPANKKLDPKPEPEDKQDEAKQKLVLEQKKPPEEAKKEEQKPEDFPKIVPKNRIAVRQHVEDKTEDNPNAEFIADQANKVAEQTQARITATDQNDKSPSPAANHVGSTSKPGDSEESRVAQSEDRPGEQDRAPNEGSRERERAAVSASRASNPRASSAPAESIAAAQHQSAPRPGVEQGKKQQQAAEAGQKAVSAFNSQEAQADTINSENGSFGVAAAQQALKGRRAQPAKRKRLPPQRQNRGPLDLLGLGATGSTAGGVNLNLTPRMALAAVGRDRLVKERVADAERRKSAHRGSWKSVGIERWRASIENYVSSVKPGNQTALNTAKVPFASYLNQIHNRLHPIFADSFLASLGNLPGSHPMNRPEISANLEIVLDQEEGRIVRMGITKTSGVTAFDIAALESVQRAQPFGMPPREIISPDGNVYFHWEFYRNPYYACSTYFARPYLLKVKPKTAPPTIVPPTPRPYDPSESPGQDERHGWLPPAELELEKRALLR